ncbi:alpha/beta hydrolase [Comamonas sp. w2-DMI]|uniref:alpha/beta fold hydrolase n=1 Tax=Comamonas sp. w2-DMI TaxID=3126391 RepID=UPI0032E4496A
MTPLGEGGGHMVWHGWKPAGGKAHGLPLVLLHGGSGSWTHWLRAIEPLVQAGHALWLPDLPGFGDSDLVPGGTDADSMLAPLARGIRQLLGDCAGGPVCDLVGFSFGGMTAGMLAAEYPSLARRLVLVGAPGMGLSNGRAVRLKGWRHLATTDAQMQVHRYNLQALMLHDAALIDDATLALHAHNVARDRLPRRRLSQTDILARALARIQGPVAAIYGEHDPLYAGRMQALQEKLVLQTGGRVHWQEIPGAGHWVQHEKPRAFAAALLAALAHPAHQGRQP